MAGPSPFARLAGCSHAHGGGSAHLQSWGKRSGCVVRGGSPYVVGLDRGVMILMDFTINSGLKVLALGTSDILVGD